MLFNLKKYILALFVSVFAVTHCYLNPLNAELNPICHLLTLLGAHHILHVSRIRVNKVNNSVGGELTVHR